MRKGISDRLGFMTIMIILAVITILIIFSFAVEGGEAAAPWLVNLFRPEEGVLG